MYGVQQDLDATAAALPPTARLVPLSTRMTAAPPTPGTRLTH
ncbi:hypothetical protein OG252_45265 [Streptomyces sp. NBC_01352]|nr:hypothetical protein [Streptomyces sp. NBC_01352]